MRYHRLLPVLPLLFFLFACEVEDFTPVAENRAETFEAGSTSPTPEFITLLEEVNKLRREGCRCGSVYFPPVPALSWQSRLQVAAQGHAADMERRGALDHTGSDGSDVSERVSAAGYRWRSVGENIAWGYPDVVSVFYGWRDSPGHCRNMMQAQFRHMGAARVGTYWVQTLAQPVGN